MGPKSIASKFYCVLKVSSYRVVAVEHSRVFLANDTKLETDYLKVGKIMHNILRQIPGLHIVGMVTTGTQVKLLYIAYNNGYITLLLTKNFEVHSIYKKENMKILKKHLANLLRFGWVESQIACASTS